MGEREPVKGLRGRLFQIWPLNIGEQKREQERLRQECVDEIFASAQQAGIEFINNNEWKNNVFQYPKDPNLPMPILAIKELEELKKQGVPHKIEFFVRDGREPIPKEYKRNFDNEHYREFVNVAYWRRDKKNVRESYDGEGLCDPQAIGEVRNPKNQLHRLRVEENHRKFKEFEEALPQELPELYSGYQQELAEAKQEHKEREAQSEKEHKDWEERPAEYWTQLTQSIPEKQECYGCMGKGSMGPGYDPWGCDDCHGKGFIERPSGEVLRKSQEPYVNRYFSNLRPLSNFLEFVEARGSPEYKAKIAEIKAQVYPPYHPYFPPHEVYARFIVEE